VLGSKDRERIQLISDAINLHDLHIRSFVSFSIESAVKLVQITGFESSFLENEGESKIGEMGNKFCGLTAM